MFACPKKRVVAERHADLIPPVPYAAIQIRRGDKLKWGQIQRIPPESIVDSIPMEAEVLWVATDDYSVIEELRSIFPRPVLTSCLPNQRGSDTLTHQFLEGDTSHLRSETLRLLTDLELCRTADWFLRILPHRKLSQNGHSRNLQIADMIREPGLIHRELRPSENCLAFGSALGFSRTIREAL
jgi:hypothetical protein